MSFERRPQARGTCGPDCVENTLPLVPLLNGDSRPSNIMVPPMTCLVDYARRYMTAELSRLALLASQRQQS